MGETTYRQVTQRCLWCAEPARQSGKETKPMTTHLVRERLELYGATSLSVTELLGVALSTGRVSEQITERLETLLTSYSLPELLQLDFGELKQQVGKARAVQLQALLEVARRLTQPLPTKRPQIRCPQNAADLVMADMTFLDHEELRVLVLDQKNYVVANLLLYQGTVNSSVVRAAELYRPAITRKCTAIIVCHNHPSSETTPSPEDLAATAVWVEAGKLLEIDLLDHLIIGGHRFVSLKERLRWE